MGGLKEKLPGVYWSFLAGSLCLAGFPGSGGFFSKDAILAAVFERGGPLYVTLFTLGLITALLTAFYTFRMLFVVFHGTSTPLSHRSADELKRSVSGVEPVMTLTLIPLAIIGLLSGILNLPEYVGSHGLLSAFFSSSPGFSTSGHASPVSEFALQAVAAAACLLGLGLARLRYTGQRRAESLQREEAGLPLSGFLLSGWYLDNLYRLLFVRPFVRVSHFLWKMVDGAVIDGSLDGIARFTVRLGSVPAGWSTGRVATSLIALTGGTAAVLAYVVWLML